MCNKRKIAFMKRLIADKPLSKKEISEGLDLGILKYTGGK